MGGHADVLVSVRVAKGCLWLLSGPGTHGARAAAAPPFQLPLLTDGESPQDAVTQEFVLGPQAAHARDRSSGNDGAAADEFVRLELLGCQVDLDPVGESIPPVIVVRSPLTRTSPRTSSPPRRSLSTRAVTPHWSRAALSGRHCARPSGAHVSAPQLLRIARSMSASRIGLMGTTLAVHTDNPPSCPTTPECRRESPG